MQLSGLSLRQRRLIYYLQNHSGYITGTTLANHLGVSSRTIRNEVSETNLLLAPHHVQIEAKHGYGYFLKAEDPSILADLARSNVSFLTREDRIRHIITRLCLSDQFLDLYDLQDEMFISQTTLENDLAALRDYCNSFHPHIQLIREHNAICFESNERKKRAVLTRLFAENWNYNARGNTYYNYEFLEEDTVNQIMEITGSYTQEAGIFMDDINMVILNLSIAILYYRVKSGHFLNDLPAFECRDRLSIETGDRILDMLQTRFDISFPANERTDIYLHLSFSRLHDADKLNFHTVSQYFDARVILITDQYLHNILETFHMNFFQDQDFYITLLQCIYFFSLPVHHFNSPDVPAEQFRAHFAVELEIAYLFQDMAKTYFGSYLDQTELFYLAYSLHGAVGYYLTSMPKLNTVILCHLNLPACWYLKRQISSAHGTFLHIQALLPVYRKDTYDFSDTDLVLTTVNKTIREDLRGKTLHISPFFTREDSALIDTYISGLLLNRMVFSDIPSMERLLAEATWQEDCTQETYQDVLEDMIARQIETGTVTEAFREAVLLRDRLLPYACSDSIAVIHSLESAQRTHLSVSVMRHRIRKNGFKLRFILLLTIRPEHACILFRIYSLLSHNRITENEKTALKTREDLIRVLTDSGH